MLYATSNRPGSDCTYVVCLIAVLDHHVVHVPDKFMLGFVLSENDFLDLFNEEVNGNVSSTAQTTHFADVDCFELKFGLLVVFKGFLSIAHDRLFEKQFPRALIVLAVYDQMEVRLVLNRILLERSRLNEDLIGDL